MNGIRPNYYDILKVIAILLMITDHVGYFFFPQYFVLRVVGRISMPLFLFLVGYNKSSSVSWLLWGGAAMVDVSFFLYNGMGGLSHYTVSILGSIIIVKLFARFIQYVRLSDTALFLGILPVVGLLYMISPSLYPYIDYGGLALIVGLSGFVFARLIMTRYTLFSYMLVMIMIGLYCYQQVLRFHIFGGYIILFIILCLGLFLALSFLPFARISLPKTILSQFVLIISRNSLWIYIIHIIIFALISYLIYI